MDPTITTADPTDVKAIEATADTTVALTRPYHVVLVDAAAGNVAVTLPAAASCSWQQVGVRRTDAAAVHSVTITPHAAAETIDGQNDKHLLPNQSLSVYSNGTAWSSI